MIPDDRQFWFYTKRALEFPGSHFPSVKIDNLAVGSFFALIPKTSPLLPNSKVYCKISDAHYVARGIDPSVITIPIGDLEVRLLSDVNKELMQEIDS